MSGGTGSTRYRKFGVPAAWLGLAAFLAAADLVVKALVEDRLATGQSIDFGILTIQLGYNTGVAFGIGVGLPAWVVVVLTGSITTAVAVFLWLQASKPGLWLSLLGLSAVLGGAAGNFIDRLDGAGVVDYFHTGWFPTFNLADVLITLGVIALTLSTLMVDTQSPAPSNALESNPDPKNHPSAHEPPGQA